LGIAAGASAAVAAPNAMQERAVGMAAIKPEERGTYQLRAEMLEDVPLGHYPKTLVNHVGFRPEAGKYLVTYGIKGADRFEIVDTRAVPLASRATTCAPKTGVDPASMVPEIAPKAATAVPG